MFNKHRRVQNKLCLLKGDKMNKKLEITYSYLMSWMGNTNHLNVVGYYDRSIKTTSEYLGVSERTAQRHLNELVRMGLIHRIDITGQASIYLNAIPQKLDALRLVFFLRKIKKGYNGHQISLYGADKKFYTLSDVLHKVPKLELTPEEEALIY